jgi:hypothetical protein
MFDCVSIGESEDRLRPSELGTEPNILFKYFPRGMIVLNADVSNGNMQRRELSSPSKTAAPLQLDTAAIQGRMSCSLSAAGRAVCSIIEMEEDRQTEGCATPCKN